MIRFSPEWREDVIDIRVSGEYPFRLLSFDYQHGGIPVPGLDGMHTESVTGALQGLRLVSRKGLPGKMNFGYFVGPGRPRTIRPNQWCTGYSYRGRSLDLPEARRLILIPAYLWVMSNKAMPALSKLRDFDEDVFVWDGRTGDNIFSTEPLSAAAVLAAFLSGQIQQMYGGLHH